MKKTFFLTLGASALLLTACSQEELVSKPGHGSTPATFTLKVPQEFSTRSLGDGLAATQLSALIYEVTSQDAQNVYSYIFTAHTTFESNSYTTSLSLDLVTGKSYMIAFFASSPNSSAAYSLDTATGTLSVDYSAMTSADNLLDAYDCFYGSYATGLVGNSSISANIDMVRPVAQLNWGTTGLNSNSNFTNEFGANGDYILTSLNIKSAYSTFNLLDGTYGGEEEVTINPFASPATLSDASFPIENYRYVAMQYVLAPAETPATYDLALTIKNNGGANTSGNYENTITVSSAPVQADYQTNIYGSLLSASATVNVSKQKGSVWNVYDQPLIWDGTETTPEIDETNKTVSLTAPSELAGLAALVNDSENPNTFENYTINLSADFDMNNMEFPAIGSGTRSGAVVTGNSFKGVFNGQGHTISNLKISGTTNEADAIGFIPNLDGATASVTNVSFSNLLIDAPDNQQAAVIGTLTNGATVSNVTVTSGSVTAAEGAAGIVGRLILSGSITQCSNYAAISTGTNGGGIAGAAYRTASGMTASISNCTNYGEISGTSQGVGGIVGLSSAVISGCVNEGTIKGGTTSTGGIVGQQTSAGSVTNCSNSGTVVGGSGYGTGGVVGWVRYDNSDAYAVQNIISVKNCKNSASISGNTGVGGIVGVWYMCGVCSNNSNTAASLSASNEFVAGVVGDSQWTGEAPASLTDTAGQNMLYVVANYSSTLQDAMTGNSKADYVYVNSVDNTTVTGNSQTDPTVINNTGSN